MSIYACRLMDISSGHGCHPPQKAILASTNVLINSRGAHRQGDLWSLHCCGSNCHLGTLTIGSTTVLVNGKGLGRVGDPINCGSIVMTGSTNVLAG